MATTPSPRPSPKHSPKPSPRQLLRTPPPRSPTKPNFTGTSPKPALSSEGTNRDSANVTSESLQRLIHHYISSKRSLQSTAYIVKAHELVANARPSLEKIAALRARNAFARAQVRGILDKARTVKTGLETVNEDVSQQFRDLLKGLDKVDERVKQSIRLLKSTTVDAAFGPGDGQRRTLHDFLDGQRLDEITGALHTCIDSASEAQGDFGDLLAEFNDRIEKIENGVDGVLTNIPDIKVNADHDEPVTITTAGGKEKTRATDDGIAVMHFRELESHATEMAAALQSLVRNYDLCITALKHTEGGGEAALQAQAALLTATDHGSGSDAAVTATATADNPEAFSPVHQPMSEEERSELLDVLEKDADMVEEVVLEIRDRALDMESHLSKIYACVSEREAEREGLCSAVDGLQDLNQNMDGYIDQASRLTGRWLEIKERIQEQMAELEGIGEFFAGFLDAYTGLLSEVRRRETLSNKMDKIARDALAKIEKLYQEDLEDRESFRADKGEFLPLDLWPGMTDVPDRFEIRRVAMQPPATAVAAAADGVIIHEEALESDMVAEHSAEHRQEDATTTTTTSSS